MAPIIDAIISSILGVAVSFGKSSHKSVIVVGVLGFALQCDIANH